MRHAHRFIAFWVLLITPLSAQPTATGSWTATGTVVSQYLFRGLRFGGPSFQPMVEYDRGGAAVGIWASTPLVDRVPGQSDPEIDPYASYKFVLNEALSIQPGATAYFFPRAEPANGFYRATFEPNVALNYTTHGVTFTPKLYYDVVMRGPTYEFNAAYALPVKEIGSEVDVYATVGAYEWDAAIACAQPRTEARGDYWSVNATVPFQISATSKITGSLGYFAGDNATLRQRGVPTQPNSLAAHRVVASIGYSITF